MTRTKKARQASASDEASPKKSSGLSPVRWINPTLTVSDVAWLEDNGVASLEDLIVLFENLPPSQHLSGKFDPQTGRWLAILFDNVATTEGFTPAISVRGATAIDALLVLGYFVIRKYPDGWQGVEGKATGRFG